MIINNPLVSVIIPTKNSSKTLDVCLESIKNQSYKNIEIIVVDNNSTDNTKEIALKYTDKVLNKGPERSAQVNYGVEKADGLFVYKVDSDFVLNSNVVEQCVEKIKEGFDAVVVHNSPDVRVSWIAKIRKFEVDMYKYNIAHSSARFVKRDIYQKIKGFNDKITAGKDYDFQNKLNRAGIKTGFIDAEALHLGEPTSIWKHMVKYFDYGKDFVNYADENNTELYNQLKFLRAEYIKNWKIFLKKPFLGLSFIFYNFLKFGFGGTGFLIMKLTKKIKKTVPDIVFPDKISEEINKSKKITMNNPLVSIIIACKNNEEYIEQSLQSVKNQTYKNIELIIVDNFSTDKTFEIGKKYTDQIYQLGPERSTQFNYGFKKSKGELIYRIGAEFVLELDLVEKCVNKINEGYDALALHNRSVGDSIWAKVRFLERESYRNDNSIVAVRFMKREVFENVGMFDEALVAGEDFDLHNRMVKAGYRWCHVDAVESHLGEPKNIIDVWNKFYYYGRTIQRYREKNKVIAKKQLVMFRPSFRKILKKLLISPRLFIAFCVYMFIKNVAGLCGVVRGAPKSLRY